MTIYTIPEFELYYHNTYKRSNMAEAFWNTLPIERFNLTKKKMVKKRKAELTTNHLDLPVNCNRKKPKMRLTQISLPI